MLGISPLLSRGRNPISSPETRVTSSYLTAPACDGFCRFSIRPRMHLKLLKEIKMLPLEIRSYKRFVCIQQDDVIKCKGSHQEHSVDSPLPTSFSSNSDDSSTVSSSSFASSEQSNVSNDEMSSSPGSNSNGGNGGDERKKNDDENYDNGGISDSSNENSADESEQEEDDGALLHTDDDKGIARNGVDFTDEDLSSDSDENSDLENSYPRLPLAPVDTLIAVRQRAAYKELQLNVKLKEKVIEDAKQRQQERQQAQRSKMRNRTSRSKRKHKTAGEMIFEKCNGSAKVEEGVEDDWMVDCSCGIREKNYDDGTSMIQCDSCSHWVHAKCANKQPEIVAQEHFLCFRCGWMFDCVCHVRRQPNHDDGHRMVECESCNTWQHTTCVGIPMTEEPADDYRCPRCIKKGRRLGAVSRTRNYNSRQRQRGHLRGRRNVTSMDADSAARFIKISTPPRAHNSWRTDSKNMVVEEKKYLDICSPSPSLFPAGSPPTTSLPSSLTPPPPPSGRLSRKVAESLVEDRKPVYHEQSKVKQERHSSQPQRKLGRSLPNRSLKRPRLHTVTYDQGHVEQPQNTVILSPRGKGPMLQGYLSVLTEEDTLSSQSLDVRPSITITKSTSASGDKLNGRKRKSNSARNRLAKKLRGKK
ncbi:putative Zinc finger, PHD-type, Zinc finger, FYVE/PHD-type, Zinc finger, RING/FYVE/PHD-type [Plasmopara halstedii]